MKVINHKPPTRTMGLPQPLTIETAMRQVRRWATVHPARGEPITVHPEVAMMLADWGAADNEPSMAQFGRDGTITDGLNREVRAAMRTSQGPEYLGYRAVLAYIERVRAVAP